ncbi:MAG: RagB/SusD family nutrient uptake outer membrane protein [Bacteroidales bacterium]
MKKYIQQFIILIIFTGTLVSCEKFLSPGLDNRLSEEEMLNDPAYFEGLLLHAYRNMPSATSFDEDIVSDDAVTNDKNSNYTLMATGEWKASFYPMSKWSIAYNEIFYINAFLAKMDQVVWSWQNEEVNDNHYQRLKGEAHGLRAWWMFQLLQYHGGMGADGTLLGFPISLEPLTIDDEFRIPRNTYAACVDQILSDIDTAVAYLPNTFKDIPGDAVYNSTFGARFTNRISGLVALSLKSRVTLLAASPAYNYLNWEDAAQTAGEIIADNGGLAAISPTGLKFFENHLDPEIIWCNSRTNSNSLEVANFPPSKYGNGRINPTHNLVDVFPMSTGLPVDEVTSGFDPSDPYTNRDPRLKAYIAHHGNVIKDTIYTDATSAQDGNNKLINSTRSGYYLKKFLLDSKVNLAPGNVTQADHFITYFRFTELFLNYAEAANEAWGPDADPMGYGFTAREVISAIRNRGGLPDLATDTYLNSMTPSANDMREVIRNERRIELCFEGFRFWDIRRWNLTGIMSAPVEAMNIDFSKPEPYNVQFLENRGYADYMIYGPVPYNETLKYDLIQNKGW